MGKWEKRIVALVLSLLTAMGSYQTYHTAKQPTLYGGGISGGGSSGASSNTAVPYGTCLITHVAGQPTAYIAAANTDAARWTALKTAVLALQSYERLDIGPGNYISSTELLLCPTASNHNTISGAGWNTVIKSTAATTTNCVVTPNDYLEICNLSIYGTSQAELDAGLGAVANQPFGNQTGGQSFIGLNAHNLYINGGIDCFFIKATAAPSTGINNGTFRFCTLEGNWDNVRIFGSSASFYFDTCTFLANGGATSSVQKRNVTVTGGTVTCKGCNATVDATNVTGNGVHCYEVANSGAIINVIGGSCSSIGTTAFDLLQSSGALNATPWTVGSGTNNALTKSGTITPYGQVAISTDISGFGTGVATALAITANASNGLPTIVTAGLNALLNVPGSVAQGNVLYYNGTNWVYLVPGTAGKPFVTGGSGANPSYTTLSVGGGGTGKTTITTNAVICGNGTGNLTVSNASLSGAVLIGNGAIPQFSAHINLGTSGGGGDYTTQIFGSTSGDTSIYAATAGSAGLFFILPGTAGGANQLLLTDGSGNTSWTPHLLGSGSAPAVATGTGAGITGSPSATYTGTDTEGLLNVTTATSPAIGGTVVTATFSSAFPTHSRTVITPANASTALLSGATMVYVTNSTTTFVVTAGTTGLTGATTYSWNVHTLGD